MVLADEWHYHKYRPDNNTAGELRTALVQPGDNAGRNHGGTGGSRRG